MVDRREFRFEFPCPSCQARLRLKDRHLIGTRWSCPECQSPLEIRDAGHGDLTARLCEKKLDPMTAPRQKVMSPRIAAMLVAIILITGVAVLVLSSPEQPPSSPSVPVVEKDLLPAPQSPIGIPPSSPTVPVQAQLSELGTWLNSQHDKNGAFPAAVAPGDLPLDERFSWLAQFIEETEPQASVHADHRHSWRDPANEAFVRRRATALLNPQVDPAASDDGYPASNFVGVAGVGADAAQLPKSHPRAGVFGIDRRTTRDDVKDGTSNTFLVLGVEAHPPAWAHGTGSVRGLTAEPYFRGPDQFGTGQPDGMTVLMADGSVRVLSSQTDPRLMRRMAAMADGLPLDVNVPGEPADRPVSPTSSVVTEKEQPLPVNNPAGLEPITVEVAPERTGYNVEQGLSPKIAKYQIETPVPLRVLLREIVEMSALPIDMSAIQDDPRLETLISLDLQETTLKGILTAALQQAHLEFTADEQGIHLQGGAAAPDPSPLKPENALAPSSETAP